MSTATSVGAYSVKQFCQAHTLSRAFLYKLIKEGRGPKTIKVGRRTLISAADAQDWFSQLALRRGGAR